MSNHVQNVTKLRGSNPCGKPIFKKVLPLISKKLGTLAGRDRGANFLIRLEAIDFNFIEMRCRIPPKEKITITIHPLLFDRIEKLRSQYQISRSEMVREALDRYLEAIERAEGIAA